MIIDVENDTTDDRWVPDAVVVVSLSGETLPRRLSSLAVSFSFARSFDPVVTNNVRRWTSLFPKPAKISSPNVKVYNVNCPWYLSLYGTHYYFIAPIISVHRFRYSHCYCSTFHKVLNIFSVLFRIYHLVRLPLCYLYRVRMADMSNKYFANLLSRWSSIVIIMNGYELVVKWVALDATTLVTAAAAAAEGWRLLPWAGVTIVVAPVAVVVVADKADDELVAVVDNADDVVQWCRW